MFANLITLRHLAVKTNECSSFVERSFNVFVESTRTDTSLIARLFAEVAVLRIAISVVTETSLVVRLVFLASKYECRSTNGSGTGGRRFSIRDPPAARRFSPVLTVYALIAYWRYVVCYICYIMYLHLHLHIHICICIS